MPIAKICNKIIEYSFYALFFFVPLAFASDTFELFEFNKMWLTYALTIIIGASWFIKMVASGNFRIQRTPLDIPIALFLTSQIISTIFSWDTHISIWGYYSRFNGGLLSIISYIFLYYAFLSNVKIDLIRNPLEKREPIRETGASRMVKRLIFVSLTSGTVVALWGLPSHFGYDPTCFLFRGTLDVSCWTTDFQPLVRIFSTLGQPSWLAAYLAILLPTSIAFAIQKTQITQTVSKSEKSDRLKVQITDNLTHRVFRVFWNIQTLYILLTGLFYLDLLYSGAKSGFLAVWLSLGFFFAAYFWINRKKFYILHSTFYILVLLAVITFIAGQPFPQIEKFTLRGIKNNLTNTQSTKISQGQPPSPQRFAGELGGTDSGTIRKIVWQGAFGIWRNNPIFGTGVETFAFAYYRFRPEAHNLTSEWNFLYNKAHNEYLNYLATTGAVGLGTYLLMIGWFLKITFQKTQNTQKSGTSESQTVRQSDSPSIPSVLIIIALVASYISILITNFFGFSVVITNIYLFLIPAFVFVLMGIVEPQKAFVFPKIEKPKHLSASNYHITPWMWTYIVLIVITALYMLTTLIRFWNADKAYALGSNLDRAGEYQQAYPKLIEAVAKRGGEPVFKDELAVNNAIIAAALINQEAITTSTDSASLANQLAQNAITLNNSITSAYPNNILFWKSRIRIFYALSQADPAFLINALEAVKKAQTLAPTDANISYNLGVLYGQNNDTENGIKTLEQTIKLKPDYRDAYYALGLFYHDRAVDENGKVVDRENLQKAIAKLQYILENLSKDEKITKETLDQWMRL